MLPEAQQDGLESGGFSPAWRGWRSPAAMPTRRLPGPAAPSNAHGATPRGFQPNRCGRSAPRSPRSSASRTPGASLDEALALDRRQHGPEAAETARSLSQLGNLYLRWGRPEDALPPLQEAAAIDQMRLGPAHPFIADDLHDLGFAYEALNRPERARRLFLAALAVLERGHGETATRRAPPIPNVALSRVERQLGSPTAADAAQRDARRILNAAEAEERRRERRA